MQIQFNRYAGNEPSIVAAGLPDGADALIFTKAANGLCVRSFTSRKSEYISSSLEIDAQKWIQ